MDKVAPDPPLNVLKIPQHLRASLETAGIQTVGHLEKELEDEQALMLKVHGCGKKSVLLLRQAVQEFRTQSPTRESPSASNPSHPLPPSPDSTISKKEEKKRSLTPAGVIALVVFMLLLPPVVVGLTNSLVYGNELSSRNHQLMMIMVFAALVFVFFALFRSSKGYAEGTVKGIKFKVAGPCAALISIILTYSVTQPSRAFRNVEIYLSGSDSKSVSDFGNFRIFYRKATGPGEAPGHGNSASIRDMPWEATQIVIDRIECFGYQPEIKSAGKPSPWVFDIAKRGDVGEVTIAMTPAHPRSDKMPSETEIRNLWLSQGLKEDDIKRPGKHVKTEVSLTLVNETDRTIDFVGYDCAAILKLGPRPPEGDDFDDSISYRNLQLGVPKVIPNFGSFWNPTGWFAVYVRYKDAASNEWLQKPVGVYNIFNVREPKIVIQRKDSDGGVAFELSENSSLRE